MRSCHKGIVARSKGGGRIAGPTQQGGLHRTEIVVRCRRCGRLPEEEPLAVVRLLRWRQRMESTVLPELKKLCTTPDVAYPKRWCRNRT